jgi:uncharacterized protein (TIGR01777 family)
MKMIVTGGTGLIGRALAVELLSAGHEVLVLTRRPETARLPAGAQALAWDGRTAQGWGNWVDDETVLINLAGEPVAGSGFFPARWTPERKERIRQSRLGAGRAVVEAVQQAAYKPQAVIQASAVGYYGPSVAPHLTEESAPGTDFLAGVCVDWEASTAPVEALGVRRAVIRIGVVLSPEGGALPRQAMLFRWFAGGPLGSGQQGYPWIHLDDVSGAIRFLAEAPQAQGAFNLAAPQPVTNADFGRALGKALNRPYWMPAPAFAFRLAFGEVATILLDGQMAYPSRLMAAGYPFRFPHLPAALDDLLTIPQPGKAGTKKDSNTKDT